MNVNNTIEHLAFIVDGNRRWAQENKLPITSGHRAGFERVKDITFLLSKYAIKYVTYYMFSIENWQRPKQEVDFLMGLFSELSESIGLFKSNNARFITIGNTKMLPKNVQKTAQHLMEETKNNTQLTVMVALNYSGRDEIMRAIKKVIADVTAKKIDINALNEQTFESYLDTYGAPFPDAVIRTSENRISNFLLWQTAYSEMFSVDKYWPEFNEDDLQNIIEEYSRRKRRYGK